MLNGRKERFKKHFKRDFRLLGEQKKKKEKYFCHLANGESILGGFPS